MLSLLPASGLAKDAESKTAPQGAEKAPKTKALEAGAKSLQDMGPVEKLDMYLVGFHPMKEDPGHSMVAHHYCRQVNEDFAQCILFDGNTATANMNGIEYIISEKLFETLPAEERRYWHPHNYEILSGQLTLPGLPAVAEKEALKGKLNSYGKTWHLWNTGEEGKPGDKLPLGKPMLAWSYNADGEIRPAMEKTLERQMEIDISEKRRQRADLTPLAKPQEGVDALKASFPDRKPIPGVMDKKAGAVLHDLRKDSGPGRFHPDPAAATNASAIGKAREPSDSRGLRDIAGFSNRSRGA
jgi:hypothetical protein